MNTSIQEDICVAFDLDDTLYKERDYVAEGRRNVARVMAKRSGIDADELFELMQNAQSDRIVQGSPSNGQAAFDLLHQRLQSTPAATATIDDYLDIYRSTRPSLQLPESTVSALERLREMGVTLGIITDGRHITQWNKIEALGLEKYIDHNNIIISDDIGYDKYSHRPFAELAGRIGAQRYICRRQPHQRLSLPSHTWMDSSHASRHRLIEHPPAGSRSYRGRISPRLNN